MEWLQYIERIGLLKLMKKKYNNSSRLNKFLECIDEQLKLRIYGINAKFISNISVDQHESKKGQVDEIMNQLNKENVLVSEDPFFDLKKLDILREIGKGGFGTVYLAKSKETSEEYAIKVSNMKISEKNRFSDETLSMFCEIKLMSSFNYPTILKFIGYSPTDFDDEFYPAIIMEFCKNMSLHDVIELENNGFAPKGWDETKKLINIYGIASGMKYLHQHDIMHRDLKSKNILIDDSYCPKVADFGWSKMTKVSEISKSINLQSQCLYGLKGTPIYMAPEILREESSSKEGDVYAFSIIMYEIITGITPFLDLNFYQICMKIGNGERPKLIDSIPEHFRNLIKKCWAQSPSERPTFEEIVDELRNNSSFITDSIDESNYLDFVDNYQSTFDLSKKHIAFNDFIMGKHGNKKLKEVNIEDES